MTWEQRISGPLRALRLDSVRTKLLVFGVLATLVPSLSTAWLSYVQNKQSLTEKIGGELRSVSTQTARETDLWVRERFYELRVFTGSYEVSENLDRILRGGAPAGPALRRLGDFLNSVRSRFTDYAELLAVSTTGAVVASTAGDRAGVPLPGGWERALRDNQNAILSDSSRDAAGARVVVLAVPIYATRGRLLGALVAKLRVRALEQVVRRFAAGASTRVELVAPDGRRLAASDAPAGVAPGSVDGGVMRRLAARENAVVPYADPDGAEALGVMSPVPGLSWEVVAAVPAAEAFRQVRRLRDLTFAIVAALLVGVGLLALVVGLLITRPVGRLAEGARRVAAGDLAVDLPVTGGGELGYLTEVFNDMVARLREGRRELERLSVTDPLTGLYNRRYLMDTLAAEVRRSRRLEHPCALLMADLDRFKEYNDAHGHPAGDTALSRVAAVLRDCTRDVDCVARYGGEEFVVLMPETDAAGATGTAERIRARLAGDEGVGGRVTFSIGVAQFPADGGDPEALLASADRALYQAKREGRDRVARAGPAKR